MPPLKELDDARIVGRWLAAPGAQPVPIPFGCMVSSTSHRVFATIRDGLASDVFIQPTTSPGEFTRVHPGYAALDSIRSDGRVIGIEVFQVISDRDRAAAMQTLTRSHYLAPPRRGMLLACRFRDHGVQSSVRTQVQRRGPKDSDSMAWLTPTGGIVACAVVDHLFHGDPMGRRVAVRTLMNRAIPERWDRRKIVNEFRFAWISRFAVDAPYRGLGIGRVLARHALRLAADYLTPRPQILEVITTVTAASGALPSLGPTSRDFLCRAGYTRVDTLYPSRPTVAMDDATGFLTRKTRAKKAYYFAAVRRG